MRKLFGCALGAAAVVALMAGIGRVEAATPKDGLVIADFIDDMISLDPAEVFEFSAAEAQAQIYDRLVTYPVEDVTELQGLVAESWTVSDDGMLVTFKIRPGIKFHSGNPLTAKDVEFSLRRVVKLNLSPGFILTQFGFTPENMQDTIKAVSDDTLVLKLDRPYAPTFLLYCLTAGVGSVVDSKLAMQHEKNGDMGHEWLKTNSAGSGPFKLRAWKPNESIAYDANPDYWRGAPKFKRVITRHVPEPATQRLLLEKGDIDIARKLTPEDLAAVGGNKDIDIVKAPKGAIWYLGLNQKNPYLAKPEVREAMKWLVDYDSLVSTILKGKAEVHQTFLPRGFLGAIDDKPYRLDVAKAKELLKQARLENGFKVTMDTRNNSPTKDLAQAIQASMAKAGIQIEIIPADNKQTLTKYRARQHDIYIGQWGPDYQDPHTNADTFAANPDNSDDAKAKPLAWRNAWDIPEMTKITQAAVLERDAQKRAKIYEDLQRDHLKMSPFVIFAQEIENIAQRSNVKGMIWGPSFDDNRYWQGYKE
ncbi:ABC transporter substrate-binding protein [Benzoatithermus flavus]|uniref:ABC transporter substrate-binding protein n=1 Tax=Benzoatithermus flavus TaxID=3108223 RepID=A0ABU8XNX4_9PROT